MQPRSQPFFLASLLLLLLPTAAQAQNARD